jgi:hypothetical protein
MEKKKEFSPEAAGAAVVGFLGGVAVGRYLLDEILSDEELKEIKKQGKTIIYRCPKCNDQLKVVTNFCANCVVSLELAKKKKEP